MAVFNYILEHTHPRPPRWHHKAHAVYLARVLIRYFVWPAQQCLDPEQAVTVYLQ